MAPFSTTVAQVAFWRQPSKVNKKNLAGDNADSGGAWRPVFLGQVAEVGAAWAIARSGSEFWVGRQLTDRQA